MTVQNSFTLGISRRLFLAFTFAIAAGLASIASLRAAGSAPPVVALAPIIRVDADARPGEPESLTPLLQAGLSEDARWRMVERDQLGTLEAEWAISQSGLVDSATAVRQGRLVGASLILICRPETGDLSKPAAVCEVLDAVTAEPLASARAALSDRPFARWYRNPPQDDVSSITAAFRTALAEALATHASEVGRRLVTPLYFTGPAEHVAQLEQALTAELARSPAVRMRRAPRLDGTRGEALLAASDFVQDRAAVAGGAYLWGRLEPSSDPGASVVLRYWVWTGTGAPQEQNTRGDATMLAAEIVRTLSAASASSNGAGSAENENAASEIRLRLARQMTDEAKSLARSTGLSEYYLFSRLPSDMPHEPLRIQVLRLLASAALLAPTDSDTQELWLRTALSREYSFSIIWRANQPPIVDQPLTPEARRLRRELVAFADAFWQRPDGSLDLRLLGTAFSQDALGFKGGDFMPGLRRAAALIGQPRFGEIEPHRELFDQLLETLREQCPEYNRFKQQDAKTWMTEQRLKKRAWELPPTEVVAAFETLAPVLKIFCTDERPYPYNSSFFYPQYSTRLRELFGDRSVTAPRAASQPRIVSTTVPSLFPPVAKPVAYTSPAVTLPGGAEPPKSAVSPEEEARKRAATRNALQAFQASLKGKSDAEQDAMTRAFMAKMNKEAGLPAFPATPAPQKPAAPARVDPIMGIDAIASLSPKERQSMLRQASDKPGQIEVVRALLKAGANPLGTDGETSPPLLRAIHWNREDYVNAMLDTRPDLTRSWPDDAFNGPTGVYLLHAAISRGMLAVANRLIDLHPEQVKGTHIVAHDSLLGAAILQNDIVLVRRLFKLGARYFEYGEGAFIRLVQRCRKTSEVATASPAERQTDLAYVREVMALLHEQDAEIINLTNTGPFGNQESPLLSAVERRHYELVELLIAAGASPLRGRSMEDKSIPDLAAADPVMQRLLQGQPLSKARVGAAGRSPDGAAMVALLQKRDGDPLLGITLTPELLAYQDSKKWTLLHHAIEYKRENEALKLIAAGAPLEASSVRGQTPLTFAIAQQQPRVIEALLAKGANPSGRGDGQAISPLRMACSKGDLALMRRLIAAGADINQKVYQEHLPLVVAAASKDTGIEGLRILVEAGARLDATDDYGYGAAEYAISHDRPDALEYLRSKGAKWSRPLDNPDHTPVRLAVRWGSRNALLYLLRNGERDPGALATTTDPGIRALLSDAMQQDAGGKLFSDEELWPAICKDADHWKERVDAHLAAGGDVNYGSMDWTPLMLAINACNLDLVRYLLAKGADPKIHPQRYRNQTSWRDYDAGTLRHAWNLSYVSRQGRFDETVFAEVIKLLVPLEPTLDHQDLFLLMMESNYWVAAEAFLKAGLKPADYLRKRINDQSNLKGARLERALALLDGKPLPAVSP